MAEIRQLGIEDVVDEEFPKPRARSYDRDEQIEKVYQMSRKMQKSYARCGVRLFIGRFPTFEEIEDRRRRASQRDLY